PAGGDAHTFDPDPAVVASIADADVIFGIGEGFEPWLADMLDASGTSARFVEIAPHLDLIGEDGHHEEGHQEDDGETHEDEGDDHDHGPVDPHIWGNARNAIHGVGIIRDTLMEVDAANDDAYAANADAYIADLEALDASIRERVAT